jgi:amino acid permease
MVKNTGFYEAITTLVGTIIGAGVLALPYAIMKAGFLTGILNLAVLSVASLLTYLFIGEVVLRTKGNYQLTGYARKYLGNFGGMLMTFAMVFGIYGALTAYIVGVGRSLAELFRMQGIAFHLVGISIPSNIIFSIAFFIFVSSIVCMGIRVIGKSELIMSTGIIILLLAVSVLAMPKITASNLASFDFTKIFVPYGVILFALAGAVAVPEMKEELIKNKNLLKKAILIGVWIPIILYFLFSLSVVGSCGKGTTEIATICLGEQLGTLIFLIGNLFAIFAMSTSFLALALGLKEMYNYDYKIKKQLALVLACIVPLILFFLILAFLREEIFYKTINISGGITMTLEGILMVLMFNRAKKLGERKPEYSIRQNKFISALIILLYALGMLYTILHFLA